MPIHSNLREGARAERTQFFVEFVQKVHKNALFGLFFLIKNLPAAQIILSH